MIKRYYIYIMTSVNNVDLYIGFTGNLHRRIHEHKIHLNEGYAHEHKMFKLVYYEVYYYVNDAIKREKQLKMWKRSWKNELISAFNPSWYDISDDPRLPTSKES